MKRESISKFSTKKKYEKNPFIVELEGKMFLQPKANTVVAKGQEIIDTNTGEVVQESVLLGRRKIVDKSQFAKIYASEIGALFELSKTAINVFLYLSKVMDYENKAFFNWKEVYKNYGSAYKGVKELMRNNIIAPTLIQNVYWLNPTVVCKGERFAKYTEYVTEDYAKKQGEGMLKKQGSKLIQDLDPVVQKKYSKASNQGYHYQPKLFGGYDKIDPNTGEVISSHDGEPLSINN